MMKSLFVEGENKVDYMRDVTIECRDGNFRCHSFVLCHTCPTLKTMYDYSLKEGRVVNKTVLINATEFSVIVMKSLISLLYDWEDNDQYYSIFDGNGKFLVDLLEEYIKAKDYFGIKFGRETIPFTFEPSDALRLISRSPPFAIYDKWRDQLYEIIYNKVEDLDPNDEKNSFLFTNPELCKKIMELYNKKIKKR